MDNKENSGGTNCPQFEEWWLEHGIKANIPTMENAFKEIAFKGWVAAAEKCVKIYESWGNEGQTVIRLNLLSGRR